MALLLLQAAAALLLPALLRAGSTAAPARATVNFDFGWRYAPAQEQRYLAQCTFVENMNYGQGNIATVRSDTKEACCSECANREDCLSWDWSLGRWGGRCYLKDNAEGGKAEKGKWSGKLQASFTKNASFSWPGHRAVPVQALPTFDDAAWEVVDTPHDFGRERRMETCLGGGRRRLSDSDGGNATAAAAVPNNCSGFYRKHFKLPASWQGGVTWIYFEGVYHNSAMWLNGQPLGSHENGYTSFWHRIDRGAKFGDAKNVLAVYANGNPATGFWYGGAGLTRHQYLVHTPSSAYLPPDRSWVHATDISKITANGAQPSHGQQGTATLVAEGCISNGASAGGNAKALNNVWVTAQFIAASGQPVTVASASAGPFTIAAGATQNFTLSATPTQTLEMWSVARPFLYTAQLQVHVGGAIPMASAAVIRSAAVDSQNLTFGVREITLDANKGMQINGLPVKMRGYCDHSTFGGVGAAVPDRVQLFHAQALRAAGGNSWRMAHNPPVPARLDIADRIGVLILDENHFYGEHGAPCASPTC